MTPQPPQAMHGLLCLAASSLSLCISFLVPQLVLSSLTLHAARLHREHERTTASRQALCEWHRQAAADDHQLRRFTEATHRTTRWLDRCIAAHARPQEQNLFGIVQGGLDAELRAISIQAGPSCWL